MAVMKKGVGLSLMCALSLYAAEAQLGTIDVEAKADTEVIKDVHGEDIKSADLAEALFKQSPSVSIVRRSGIANDIIVRGQKKDNISVTIDGAKVCGACPNRMDPPVSHVLTNNIDYIQINEGPYDVENFGVLSADVKIHTIKPSKEARFPSAAVKRAFASCSPAPQKRVISIKMETGMILSDRLQEISHWGKHRQQHNISQNTKIWMPTRKRHLWANSSGILRKIMNSASVIPLTEVMMYSTLPVKWMQSTTIQIFTIWSILPKL